MIFKDVGYIKEKMNECARKRIPFFFAVNFELTEGYFIENPLQQSEVYFQIGGVGNKPVEKPSAESMRFAASPIGKQAYKEKFDIVHRGLMRGDSFLTNLTIRTPIETDISLCDIFRMSRSNYQVYIPGRFVCFSPEIFVRMKQGKISTYPMKGTIDASVPDAENVILNDFKETAEHNTIVDLMRNDLSINARNVKVERFRYLDKIVTRNKTILQVSSKITGQLPDDYHGKIGDIIFSMLPAGSISGAPKNSTVRIIRQAEGGDRGYYTGVAGYYDGENLDSGVLIRFIEESDGKLYFRSGGGITANSEWENEYQEILDKIYLPC